MIQQIAPLDIGKRLKARRMKVDDAD